MSGIADYYIRGSCSFGSVQKLEMTAECSFLRKSSASSACSFRFFWQIKSGNIREASLEDGQVGGYCTTGVGRMLTSLVLCMSSAYICIMTSFAFDSLALHIPLLTCTAPELS